MAIKRRRKINWYKVARLVAVIVMMVGVIYHHDYLIEVLTTPEPQMKSAEEMSADYRARLQKEKDDREFHEICEQEKQKRLVEQEAWLKAQQEADRVRSEKERADFIKHRRDPHGPVTIAE